MRYNLYMALSRAGKADEAQTELENFKKLESSSVRVVEAPKSSMEYLKQGKYAEAIAESQPTLVPTETPVPRYTDVTSALGVILNTAVKPIDEAISKILRGESTPRSWFADPSHLKKLSSCQRCGCLVL